MTSIYIHIPWCVKKCPYCDFNSHAKRGDLPEIDYIDALIQDFDEECARFDLQPVKTIFIGGGTPSLFHADELKRLLSHIHMKLTFTGDIEITLEANPGTIERGRFTEYFAIGINRISLGVQSFNDQHLQKLGRIHSADDAVRAVAEIKAAGFKTFNIDLMHGLPNQTPDEALADLQKALTLNPPHLSWYQLTIEPNTLFYAKPPKLPNEEALFQIEEQGKAFLAEQGLLQYEISAYATEGHQCRHNINYWQFGDYIAIGAGAHGKMHHTRYSKYRHPKDYLNPDKPFLSDERVLTEGDLPLEFMMNVLRLKEGVPAALFETATGLLITSIDSELTTLRQKQLLIDDETQLQTTPLGARFLDEVLQVFN